MRDTSAKTTWYLLVLALGVMCGPLLYSGAIEVIASGEIWPIGLLVVGVWLGLHPVSYTHLTLPTSDLV